MGVLAEFDPKRDGFSFENFNTAALSWDLYRRTYLGIAETQNAVTAPLDVAFFDLVFRSFAQPGHCCGMSMLAMSMWQLGGYYGFGSPASFYAAGANPDPPEGPARADLYDVLSIMHARQFSAPGIQAMLDTVKAGQLQDGLAAFAHVQEGLESGLYQVLALANTHSDGHVIVPIRAEDLGSEKVLHVWDPNRPYAVFPQYYDDDHNKIVIKGPRDWSYDQSAGGLYLDPGGGPLGTIYDGSSLTGWFLALPGSDLRHKASQPFSLAPVLSDAAMIFMTSTGSVIQIEDDDGRRLFAETGSPELGQVPEAAADRQLRGAFRLPQFGGLGGDSTTQIYVVDRPAGSSPLTVTAAGAAYTLSMLSAGEMIEIESDDSESSSDRIRFESDAAGRAFELSSTAPGRTFGIRHVRQTHAQEWTGVRVRNALVATDPLHVHLPRGGGSAHLSTARTSRTVDLEFERFQGADLTVSTVAGVCVDAAGPTVAAPASWRTARPSAAAPQQEG